MFCWEYPACRRACRRRSAKKLFVPPKPFAMETYSHFSFFRRRLSAAFSSSMPCFAGNNRSTQRTLSKRNMYYIIASTKKPALRHNLRFIVNYLHESAPQPSPWKISFPSLTFSFRGVIISKHSKLIRGRSSMVEHQLPKLNTRVRFPSPAPVKKRPVFYRNWAL